MNNKAFYDITSGLYLVTGNSEGNRSGCIINTFIQVASNPKRVMISLNKDNYTTKLINESKMFHISVLSKNTTMDFIKNFGFKSGKDEDKFVGFDIFEDKLGNTFVKDNSVSDFACSIIEVIDVGSHYVFIADVEETEKYSNDEVLSYEYYHTNLKGTTPKNAVSYQDATNGYTCMICGYVYDGEELPEGFVCPICGAPITMMKKNS